ncbi:MAG: hypothetical protein Q8R47_01890 [Nanoarchaeota archaeon]|nr:hypothetical protein [Nanoarchaeota archaeon]
MTYKKWTIDEVRDIAGERLFELIEREYFPNQEGVMADWFSKPNKSMGGNTPYEVCERGNQTNLEEAVMSSALGGSGLS